MEQQPTNLVKDRTSETAKGFATKTPDESTRHDRVDIFRAQNLANDYPDLSAVMIREVFEGEPVRRAIALIQWARKKAPHSPHHQYRKLKGWARRHKRGFYNPAMRKRPPDEDRRQHTAYLEQKRVEKQRTTGRAALLPSEVLALAQKYHAPSYRAELASINDAVKPGVSKEAP